MKHGWGKKYGPDMRPALTSLCILSKITSSWSEAENFFSRKLERMALNIGILTNG